MAMTKKQVLEAKRRMEKHLIGIPKLSDEELLELAKKYWPQIRSGPREELLIFCLRQSLDELFPDNKLW